VISFKSVFNCPVNLMLAVKSVSNLATTSFISSKPVPPLNPPFFLTAALPPPAAGLPPGLLVPTAGLDSSDSLALSIGSTASACSVS